MTYETIYPEVAKQRLDSGEWQYLDVRTVEEFEAGHVPGAFNIPYAVRGAMGMELNRDFVTEVKKHFPADAKLFLSCAAGIRSAGACDLLEPEGYTGITNMDGGFSGRSDPSGQLAVQGWAARGFQTSNEPVKGRTYAELK